MKRLFYSATVIAFLLAAPAAQATGGGGCNPPCQKPCLPVLPCFISQPVMGGGGIQAAAYGSQQAAGTFSQNLGKSVAATESFSATAGTNTVMGEKTVIGILNLNQQGFRASGSQCGGFGANIIDGASADRKDASAGSAIQMNDNITQAAAAIPCGPSQINQAASSSVIASATDVAANKDGIAVTHTSAGITNMASQSIGSGEGSQSSGGGISINVSAKAG